MDSCTPDTMTGPSSLPNSILLSSRHNRAAIIAQLATMLTNVGLSNFLGFNFNLKELDTTNDNGEIIFLISFKGMFINFTCNSVYSSEIRLVYLKGLTFFFTHVSIMVDLFISRSGSKWSRRMATRPLDCSVTPKYRPLRPKGWIKWKMLKVTRNPELQTFQWIHK